MSHSKTFWTIQNMFAAQIRKLSAIGYTGQGLWGRGKLLSTGQFEPKTNQPGEPLLPEHLCGGVDVTQKSMSGKYPSKIRLVSKSKRIQLKLGRRGQVLGANNLEKRKFEKGKLLAARPRVAASKRGRELRAAAAQIRIQQAELEQTK